MREISQIIREELEKINLREECRPQQNFQNEKAWEDYVRRYPTDFWEKQILADDASFGFYEITSDLDMPF